MLNAHLNSIFLLLFEKLLTKSYWTIEIIYLTLWRLKKSPNRNFLKTTYLDFVEIQKPTVRQKISSLKNQWKSWKSIPLWPSVIVYESLLCISLLLCCWELTLWTAIPASSNAFFCSAALIWWTVRCLIVSEMVLRFSAKERTARCIIATSSSVH